MATAARDQLIDDLKDLLDSGLYSDFVITCGSDTYKVLKAIVCKRSEFLAGAARFSAGKEAADGKIDLLDDEPEIVKLLVQYIYEAEYEPVLDTIVFSGDEGKQEAPHTCSNYFNHCGDRQVCAHHWCGEVGICEDFTCQDFICNECYPPGHAMPVDSMLTHAMMYEIGDKYQVTGLKELAKEKFRHMAKLYWNDAAFPIAANYAFATTPEEDKGLRDIVRKTIAEHICLLEKPDIKAMMMEYHGLVYDLFMHKALEQGWVKSGSV